MCSEDLVGELPLDLRYIDSTALGVCLIVEAPL